MCKNECKASVCRLQKRSKQSKKAIPAQKVHWLAVFVSKGISCEVLTAQHRIPAMYGSPRPSSDIFGGQTQSDTALL